MREIKRIIVHCSDSGFGDAELIDQWHKARGWKGIGYHYVILNGKTSAKGSYYQGLDGAVQPGRADEEVGAHCEGENHDSLGVCLIGVAPLEPTFNQICALRAQVRILQKKYQIPDTAIFCHNEFPSAKAQGKTCPGFDHKRLLELLGIEPNANPSGTDQTPPG